MYVLGYDMKDQSCPYKLYFSLDLELPAPTWDINSCRRHGGHDLWAALCSARWWIVFPIGSSDRLLAMKIPFFSATQPGVKSFIYRELDYNLSFSYFLYRHLNLICTVAYLAEQSFHGVLWGLVISDVRYSVDIHRHLQFFLIIVRPGWS